MRLLPRPRRPIASASAVLAIVVAMAAWGEAAAASGITLTPLMKLRLTVTQWVEEEGQIRTWTELGGDLTVTDEGAINLPMIGSVPAAGQDSVAVAAAVAAAYTKRLGLRNAPDAVIEILEYPPIYVVGIVATPGEYRFRPGMNVLQAVALGGGPARDAAAGSVRDQVALLGEQEDIHNDIVRTEARIARLGAEQAGAATVPFPQALAKDAATPHAAEIVAQETLVFEARANAIARQIATLDDLRTLLGAEIDVLEQKSAALDDQIAQVGSELAAVTSLVDRGIATVARRSDLASGLAGLKADRLDQITATMRARQAISAADRDAAALVDQRRAEVSADLQDAQAARERLLIRAQVTGRQLLLNDADLPERQRAPALRFRIVRTLASGGAQEIAAQETTPVVPGDVVKVESSAERAASPSDAAPPSDAATPAVRPEQAASVRDWSVPDADPS